MPLGSCARALQSLASKRFHPPGIHRSSFSFARLPTMSAQIVPPNDVSEIAKLSSLDFAAVVPSLLARINWRNNENWAIQEDLTNLLVSRLTAASPSPEDPLVSTIRSLLAPVPGTTPDADAADAKHTLVSQIIGSLPKDRIAPYRDALARLATDPTDAENESISTRSKEILEFLDASQAWVPRHKGDDMAFRSLDALVRTAEEMRAFVPGLLAWLQDANWPPARGCWAQLARFPEVVVDPIREELRRGEDGGWEYNLLRFVKDAVPPRMRERARGEMERIAQRPTQSEIDEEVVEVVNECLQEMDEWAERRKR